VAYTGFELKVQVFGDRIGRISEHPKQHCDYLTKSQFSALVLFTKSGKGKGKATPSQALTGTEGSRRLRLPDFKTIGT
jgi:hypothetical protein